MAKVKYDLSKVPRELLEQYIRTHTIITGEQTLNPSDLGAQIRKAAEVTLRTRAEVDADIVKAVRDYCKNSSCHISRLSFTGKIDGNRGNFPDYIEKLMSEETSD